MEIKQLKNICKEDIFQAVFLRHSEELFRFLYYKSGDEEKARDLVQDTFTRLWLNCKKVIFEKVKSYLYTVANNIFLDGVKHEKIVLKHREQISTHQDNETPEYKLEEKEYKEKLEQALAKLSEKQRVALLLNRIDKLSYAEIADKLNISVKAVEKRIHNALVALRKEIYFK